MWYGNYQKGQKVILESDFCGCVGDETIHLEIGRSYVLPIYEGKDTIFFYFEEEKLVSGNVKKISNLQIIYPFHRQIEITFDHKYIAESDWTVLAKEKNKSEIRIEGKKDNMEAEFYLYTKNGFEEYMEKMIKKYLKFQ